MKTQTIKPFKSLPKEYAALCRWHLPRPIHDATAYENTLEIVEAFAGFEDAMNADQRDYLDLLADLVGEYEDKTLAKAAPCRWRLMMSRNFGWPQRRRKRLLSVSFSSSMLCASGFSRFQRPLAPSSSSGVTCH